MAYFIVDDHLTADAISVNAPDLVWLRWFVQNHDDQVLVASGQWRSKRLLVRALTGRPEVEVMRAAYKVGGPDAAWAVVVEFYGGPLVPQVPLPPRVSSPYQTVRAVAEKERARLARSHGEPPPRDDPVLGKVAKAGRRLYRALDEDG